MFLALVDSLTGRLLMILMILVKPQTKSNRNKKVFNIRPRYAWDRRHEGTLVLHGAQQIVSSKVFLYPRSIRVQLSLSDWWPIHRKEAKTLGR